MLKRVHVEVVLHDEMGTRTDVSLRLIVLDMNNLAPGVLQLLECDDSRMMIPVYLKPLRSPKGNGSHVRDISGKRCGNLGKHIERKDEERKFRMDILALVYPPDSVSAFGVSIFPKRVSAM